LVIALFFHFQGRRQLKIRTRLAIRILAAQIKPKKTYLVSLRQPVFKPVSYQGSSASGQDGGSPLALSTTTVRTHSAATPLPLQPRGRRRPRAPLGPKAASRQRQRAATRSPLPTHPTADFVAGAAAPCPSPTSTPTARWPTRPPSHATSASRSPRAS
jgi:hypothetical protein